jgi:HlyD family secretion protein
MAKKDYQIYQEGYRKEDIASAKAAKESAEAAVRLIQRTIQDATVVIPCDGVINERYVEPGEFVAPGTLLATVINLQDMWIMAYVSEKNLGKVRLGQTGKVFVDSYPDREFPGKVTYISPEAEFTPKNIQTREERVKLVYGVKVQIDNTEEILKPGMPADVTIEVNDHP